MSTMQKLTLLNLKRNRVRTVVTVIGILLSTALMTVVTGVVTSGRQTLIEAEINHSGDWTIELVGRFDEHSADELSQHRDVKSVYELAQVGTAKFDSISSYKPFVNLIGISENSFENCHRCELAEGRYPQRDDELLLTPQFLKYSSRTYRAGDKITFDVGGRWVKNSVEKNNLPEYQSAEWYRSYRGDYRDYEPENEDFITEFTKTYTVSGILKTAKGYLESDSSSNAIKLFTGLTYDETQRTESYQHTGIMQLRLFDNKEPEYMNVLSELTGLNEEQTQAWLNAELGTDEEMNERLLIMSQNRFSITDFSYNYSVLRARTLAVSEQTMQVLFGIATTVIIIIILSSVFIIRNSFAISITEKTRLYGMLSSVGATPRQIRRNVLFEGLMLGVVGIPLGIGLGIGVTAFLTAICNTLLSEGLNGNNIVFSVSWIGIAIAIVLSAVTIFFSTIITAIRASKIAPVDAIRGNMDVRLNKGKTYKTPKVIDRLFGIGGSIAHKNLKRSRKKYRATVVSIVASVALLLSVYSLVSYTFSYVGEYTAPVNFNMMVYTAISDKSFQDAEDCLNTAKSLDNVERVTERYKCYGTEMKFNKEEIPEEMFQPDVDTVLYGNSLMWTGYKKVSCQFPGIVALDDDSFREICAACDIDYAYAKDKGILCNKNETVDKDGNPALSGKLMKNPDGVKVELVFNEDTDGQIPEERSVKLTLAGELKENTVTDSYREADIMFNGTVLVSLDWMKKNLPADSSTIDADTLIQSSDPDRTEQDISDIMGGRVWVQNYERQERTMKGVTLVIEIFVYGFILAISLIGITNIFNTISTNMRLRAREFASLRSIGMTKREFNRMIRLESVFYSAKALFIGIPIGLLGGWIIKLIYSQNREIPYQFPWLAILISAAAVGLVVWIIMRYSIAKVRRQNIIETIRNGNI